MIYELERFFRIFLDVKIGIEVKHKKFLKKEKINIILNDLITKEITKENENTEKINK
jgi:hypothetical protein